MTASAHLPRPRSPRPPVIRTRRCASTNVHAYYGRIHALKGITLEVGHQEIVTLLGANGAGKTTTLKTISGLLHPRVGQISVRGPRHLEQSPPTSLSSAGSATRRRAADLLPTDSPGEPPDGRLTRAAQRRCARTSSDVVTLSRGSRAAKQHGGTLSGGEQQMLAIGRALMSRPRLLLLDEPSLGLRRSSSSRSSRSSARSTARARPILFVEQNALQALAVAHRGYVLQTGLVNLADTAAGLAANEGVRKAYLGRSDSRGDRRPPPVAHPYGIQPGLTFLLRFSGSGAGTAAWPPPGDASGPAPAAPARRPRHPP